MYSKEEQCGPRDRVLEVLASPQWHCELDRGTSMRIQAQEALSWVMKVIQGLKVAGGAAVGHKAMPTQSLQQSFITSN
jgi:hypothetical protein